MMKYMLIALSMSVGLAHAGDLKGSKVRLLTDLVKINNIISIEGKTADTEKCSVDLYKLDKDNFVSYEQLDLTIPKGSILGVVSTKSFIDKEKSDRLIFQKRGITSVKLKLLKDDSLAVSKSNVVSDVVINVSCITDWFMTDQLAQLSTPSPKKTLSKFSEAFSILK